VSRCKACEGLRNEAVLKYAEMTKDECNAADGCFSSACYLSKMILVRIGIAR
jgi:hypothetical protein